MHHHSDPIALPQSNTHSDYAMAEGSYTSNGGDFNPASYARHFLGSPISWRAGSFGGRFPSGSPTAQFLNSFDPQSFKMSSSIDSDRGSFVNALNIFDREGELCRNYTCCGLHLNDLHALLEHFEEVHIVVLDPTAAQPQAQIQIPFNPQSHPASEPIPHPSNHPPIHQNQQQQQAQHQQQQRQHQMLQQMHQAQQHQQQQQQYYSSQGQQQAQQQAHANQQQRQQGSQPYSTPFDPDEMELELDLDNSSSQHFQQLPQPPSSATSSISAHSSPSSGAPTPPDTPITTPLSAYPTQHLPLHPTSAALHSPYGSQPPSPHGSAIFDPAQLGRRSSHSPPSSVLGVRPNLNLNLHPFAGGMSAGQMGGAGGVPGIMQHPEDAFNSYARFSSDYSSCMPGTQYNAATVDEASIIQGLQHQQQHGQQGGQQQHGQQASQHHALQSPHLMHLQQGLQGMQLGGNSSTSAVGNGCVPPALLFSSSTEGTPTSTPSGSRVPSPTSASALQTTFNPARAGGLGHSQSQGSTPISSVPGTPISPRSPNPSFPSSPSASGSGSVNPAAITRHSSTSALNTRPASSLLLSKPFKCPKPNCNKSYKQANGLKYHMTHGSCNFAPPKDLEHVKDLLERKRRERERVGPNGEITSVVGGTLSRSASLGHVGGGGKQSPSGEVYLSNVAGGAYGDLSSITETELREVEREAERRVRPFACGVGDCQRRYKNMNGLRYHYAHSGDHGAVGLGLLASGQHECLSGGGAAARERERERARGTADGRKSGEQDREGRRRQVGSRAGSASVPVSRAGSTSRTSTPAPPMPTTPGIGGYAGQHYPLQQQLAQQLQQQAQQQQQQQMPQTQAMPFTPPMTNVTTIPISTTSSLAGANGPSSGTSTPVVAAAAGVKAAQSHPNSPTHAQALAYQQQAQFVHLQRAQYVQMQQAAQAQAAQQQQQQQQQPPQGQQGQQQQQQGYMGMYNPNQGHLDVSMS